MSLFDKTRESKSVVPIEVVDPGTPDKPIALYDQEINGEQNFAILKTTANGKYVRGGKLFYSLNGVEVYTDIDNIIFVDLTNNVLFIREYSKVEKEINPTDPEDKQYIVLYTDADYEENDDDPFYWEAYQGRTQCYEGIKSNAANVDIDKSIVLVELVTIDKALSIREFVQYLQNAQLVDAERFDINDYWGSNSL